ncbi:hypothetical protein Zm00014a_003421 [Zea mays]|uniref:Rad51-like C-terminal domain-containing protein n=1 Tax=Zea mays TaxID=4577 RepID=A0A3L6FZQ6_MAIZE|nr:hypothetical protein Zm00014a_003421 [Zea mays]
MVSAAASPPPSGKPTQDELKRLAAHRAVEFVEPGMTLGLGTGSTAAHALDRLGDLLRAGALPGVAGVPTSLKTEAHAAREQLRPEGEEGILCYAHVSSEKTQLAHVLCISMQWRHCGFCDGLIALFPADFRGRGNLSLQQKLAQMLSTLIKIAEEFSAAVHSTNQGEISCLLVSVVSRPIFKY